MKQSRAALWNQISADEIPTIRVGKRCYIAGSEIAKRSGAAPAATEDARKSGVIPFHYQIVEMVKSCREQGIEITVTIRPAN